MTDELQIQKGRMDGWDERRNGYTLIRCFLLSHMICPWSGSRRKTTRCCFLADTFVIGVPCCRSWGTVKSAMDGFWSAGGCCGVAIVDVVSVVVEEDGGGGDSEDEDGSCADKGTDTGSPCVDTGTEEMGLCCGDDGIRGLTVSVLAFDNDRLTLTRPKGCDGLFCAAYAFRTEKVMMEPTRLARVPLPPLPALAPPSLPAVSTPSPLTPTSLIALACRPFGSPVSVIVPILVLLLLLLPDPVPGNRGTDTVLSLRRRDASVRSADESDLEREGTGEGAGAGADGVDVDVDDVSRLGTEDEDIEVAADIDMDMDVDVDADGVKYVSGARAALSRPRELSTFSARRSECDR